MNNQAFEREPVEETPNYSSSFVPHEPPQLAPIILAYAQNILSDIISSQPAENQFNNDIISESLIERAKQLTLNITNNEIELNLVNSLMRMRNQVDNLNLSNQADAPVAGPSRGYEGVALLNTNVSKINENDKSKAMGQSSIIPQAIEGVSTSPDSLDTVADSAKLNEMQCKICKMKFDSISDLMIHIKSHYSKSRLLLVSI